MRLVLLCASVSVIVLSGCGGPRNYDQCILEHMRSGMNEAATYAVMEACEREYGPPGGDETQDVALRSDSVAVWVVLGGVFLALIIGWWFIFRKGNMPFWKLVRQQPDAAFEWFMAEDCWEIVGPKDSSPGPDYVGPFRLVVPKAGGPIRVYGRSDEIDDSQQRFIELYKAHVRVSSTVR